MSSYTQISIFPLLFFFPLNLWAHLVSFFVYCFFLLTPALLLSECGWPGERAQIHKIACCKCNWWMELKRIFLFMSGIHHRHIFCSDLVRQEAKVQQHDESSSSQQQHGWEDLDPRHFLSEFKESWCPLDHHTQSYAQDLEWRKNTLHTQARQPCWHVKLL